MAQRATLENFDWLRYQKTSRSFGFAKLEGDSRKIFIGTDFRVFPVVNDGKLELGLIGQDLNRCQIHEQDAKDGTEIMIGEILLGPRGLFARWCFYWEWSNNEVDMAMLANQRAEEAARVQKETEERATAATEVVANSPRSLGVALASGWTIHQTSPDGKQTIIHRVVGDKKLTKTFCVKRSSTTTRDQPQPA